MDPLHDGRRLPTDEVQGEYGSEEDWRRVMKLSERIRNANLPIKEGWDWISQDEWADEVAKLEAVVEAARKAKRLIVTWEDSNKFMLIHVEAYAGLISALEALEE
jgi:hypothetical protein